MPPESLLVFDRFRLDPLTAQVWCGDERLMLMPKAVAVLHYLLRHAGRIVPSVELQRAVWPQTRGSSTVLKVCIREIRQVLGQITYECTGQPQWANHA